MPPARGHKEAFRRQSALVIPYTNCSARRDVHGSSAHPRPRGNAAAAMPSSAAITLSSSGSPVRRVEALSHCVVFDVGVGVVVEVLSVPRQSAPESKPRCWASAGGAALWEAHRPGSWLQARTRLLEYYNG